MSKQVKGDRLKRVLRTCHETIPQLINALQSTLLKPANQNHTGTARRKSTKDHHSCLGSLQNQNPIMQMRAHFSKDQTQLEG